MEQAESSSDSPRVFTTGKWFVQLGMAARGIACCFKCGTPRRTVMQVPVRLILGVDAEKRVQRAETARASEAEKWRHFTVSTVLEEGRFDSRLYREIAELGTRRFLPNYNRNGRRVETVWAGLSQVVSNLRWSRASKLQGVVSERFARCERKKLPKGLGFQPLRDMNCSSAYRMRSERIEIRRNYLARW